MSVTCCVCNKHLTQAMLINPRVKVVGASCYRGHGARGRRARARGLPQARMRHPDADMFSSSAHAPARQPRWRHPLPVKAPDNNGCPSRSSRRKDDSLSCGLQNFAAVHSPASFGLAVHLWIWMSEASRHHICAIQAFEAFDTKLGAILAFFGRRKGYFLCAQLTLGPSFLSLCCAVVTPLAAYTHVSVGWVCGMTCLFFS